MKKRILTVAVVASMASFGLAGCGGNKDEEGMKEQTTMQANEMDEDMDEDMPMEEETYVMVGGAKMVPSKDIVDNAMGSADHKTLVAAVQAAGLVETLKGPGPFTVFAPTDAAFNKLPKGTVETLVKPENKAKLTSILTYHVVPGTYTSKDLKDGQMLKTVQGESLKVTEKNGKWYVDGAQITIADVADKNGVTHVVDAVVMPKKTN